MVVRCLLNLDEVRHLRDFLNCPEKLPYALATGKRLRHHLLSRFDFGGRRGRLSEQPQSIATIGTGVGAVRFNAIRALPGSAALFTVTADRGYRPSLLSETPGLAPGISFFTWSRPPSVSLPVPGHVEPGHLLRLSRLKCYAYFNSTFAPTFSSVALILLASSLATPSLTVFGAPSTRSLASFRPEPGKRTHFLNHLDLLVACAGENDSELGLFFSSGSRAAARRARRNRNRGGSRDAPLLFKQLGEIRRFKDGQARQFIDDFLQVSHCSIPIGSNQSMSVEPSGRCALGGIGLDHARDLRRGSIGELRDLGRRGLDQADDLGTQLIQ